MKKAFFLILILSLLRLSGQEKVNTDILKAPASPASNLLDIATTDISKPTDVSDLMIGLRNFPVNFINNGGYSVEIAPYWIFAGAKEDKTINEMLNNKHSLPQTFVISFAARNTDDSKSSGLPENAIYTALGVKFSLFRGEADEKTRSDFQIIQTLLDKRGRIINSSNLLEFISEDAEYNKLLTRRKDADIKSEKKSEIQKEIELRIAFLTDEFKKTQQKLVRNTEELKRITFKMNRIGFLWDFAGGTSLQFKEKQFNNSRIYNAGLWTVLGYAFEKSGTPLFLMRYMYNPKSDWMTTEDFKPEGNFSTFDAGLKYEYAPKDSKFTASIEGLYRSFISGSDLKPTWKYVLNLDYAVFPNQHLTLSLGKDFDNNIIKKGNVIAGLSFLSGIGSKRKIQ